MTEDGGIVGVFDFGREGRKKWCFCGKGQKLKVIEGQKNGGGVEKRRNKGKVSFTVLQYIHLCLFMILHYSRD